MTKAAACLAFAMSSLRAQTCPDRGFDFFETEHYRTGRVIITSFWLLRNSASRLGNLSELESKPYNNAERIKAERRLRQSLIEAPAAFDSRVGGTLVLPRPVHCREENGQKELDIEFLVFTTKIPFGLLPTFEHHEQEVKDPGSSLAFAPEPSELRVIPQLNYDASQGFLSGGQLMSRLPLGTLLTIEGQASGRAMATSGTLSGAVDRETGWMRRLMWRGSYAYSDRPSDNLRLKSSRGSGQISLTTAEIATIGVVRAATMFEGGNQSTGYQGTLPANLLANSRYADWRSYVGFTHRWTHQALTASFGVLLGKTGHAGAFDYHKLITDIAYDNQFRFAGTRSYLETRFTAGSLGGNGAIPISERFFGGNTVTPFAPGDDWLIHATPVLRGIPSNRLNRNTEAGVPGGTSFASLNLTLAIPVFSIPLIPDEASKDPELRGKVNEMLDNGVLFLELLNEADDPAQKDLFENHRQSFIDTTAAMLDRVDALGSMIPESLMIQYETCDEKMGDLAAQAEDIRASTPWRNFIKDDPSESNIPTVIRACLADLNSVLKDSELSRLGDALKEQQRVITTGVNNIDVSAAERKAEQSMDFPKQVIRTAFDEMKVFSVAPLATFDIARIGPAVPGQRAVRYSPGGGVRFIVASSVSFDIGYAWNLQPRPWEGRGALFFGIRFLSLFGR